MVNQAGTHPEIKPLLPFEQSQLPITPPLGGGACVPSHIFATFLNYKIYKTHFFPLKCNDIALVSLAFKYVFKCNSGHQDISLCLVP